MKTASLLSNGITDALAAPSPWATPGSDEALGGALLTPIPWLQPNHHGIGGPPQSGIGTPGQRSPTGSQSSAPSPGMSNDLEGEVRTESTETIDGPNGVGSIETVSVSVNGIPSMGARGIGVTQGELLRQEQRAGVVPVSQLVPSHHVHGAANPHAQAHRRQSSGSPPKGDPANPQAQASGTPPEERQKSLSPPDRAQMDTSPASTGAATPSIVMTTEDDANANTNVVGSVTGGDEEKPHARGPEEIGAEDTGPQPQHGSGSNTSTTTTTSTGGVEMQGIDVEAAVGRKATSPAGSKSPGAAGDKMDVETASGPPERSATPKREAEDELRAQSESKKLKEEDGEGEGVGDAMDMDDMEISAEDLALKEHEREPQPQRGAEEKHDV